MPKIIAIAMLRRPGDVPSPVGRWGSGGGEVSERLQSIMNIYIYIYYYYYYLTIHIIDVMYESDQLCALQPTPYNLLLIRSGISLLPLSLSLCLSLSVCVCVCVCVRVCAVVRVRLLGFG